MSKPIPICLINVIFVLFSGVLLKYLRLWLPLAEFRYLNLNKDKAIFLLTHVGDQFCSIVQEEKQAKAEAMVVVGDDTTTREIAVKETDDGFREMCDDCRTTLFNFHWVCRECGFCVCNDCYKERKAHGNGKEDGDNEEQVLVPIFLLILYIIIFLKTFNYLSREKILLDGFFVSAVRNTIQISSCQHK